MPPKKGNKKKGGGGGGGNRRANLEDDAEDRLEMGGPGNETGAEDEREFIDWDKDPNWTDKLIRQVQQHDSIRRHLLGDGDGASVNDAYYQLAGHVFKDSDTLGEQYNDPSLKEKFVEGIKKRWDHLVHSTKDTDKELGDQYKIVIQEDDIDGLSDDDMKTVVRKKQKDVPWWLKMRNLISVLPAKPLPATPTQAEFTPIGIDDPWVELGAHKTRSRAGSVTGNRPRPSSPFKPVGDPLGATTDDVRGRKSRNASPAPVAFSPVSPPKSDKSRSAMEAVKDAVLNVTRRISSRSRSRSPGRRDLPDASPAAPRSRNASPARNKHLDDVETATIIGRPKSPVTGSPARDPHHPRSVEEWRTEVAESVTPGPVLSSALVDIETIAGDEQLPAYPSLTNVANGETRKNERIRLPREKEERSPYAYATADGPLIAPIPIVAITAPTSSSEQDKDMNGRSRSPSRGRSQSRSPLRQDKPLPQHGPTIVPVSVPIVTPIITTNLPNTTTDGQPWIPRPKSPIPVILTNAGKGHTRNMSGGGTPNSPSAVVFPNPVVINPVIVPVQPTATSPEVSRPLGRPNSPSYVIPAYRASSKTQPAVPSSLRNVEPPPTGPSRRSFPEPDVAPRPFSPNSNPNVQPPRPIIAPPPTGYPVPSPFAVAADFHRPPAGLETKASGRRVVSDGKRPQQIPSDAATKVDSGSRGSTAGIVGASMLAGAALARSSQPSAVDAIRTGGDRSATRQDRKRSASGDYPSTTTIAPRPQPRGIITNQPYVSVSDPTGALTQSRPLGNTPVTFEFGGMNDPLAGTRGGTGARSSARNPPLTVTVSPIIHPVGSVPVGRSRSNSDSSEATVRQNPRLTTGERTGRTDRYTLSSRWDDNEDRSILRRRRYDDNDTIRTTRTRRYVSPARSEMECDCSSCRNAWIWRSVEYCGIAVAFTLYLGFIGKILFQRLTVPAY